jgi:cell division septal protein FtsQ
MSREGRWRLLISALRVAGAAAVLGALGWVAWIVTDVLREDAKKLPAVARADPVRHFELLTRGVLDEAWLRQALALPPTASLLDLDLEQLRARLLAHGQVNAATITRKFPDTLSVQLTERSPVVRVKVQVGDKEPKTLLVARDGVVFEGVGFDPAMVETLPWLDGVTPRSQGNGFLPFTEIEPAANLLAKARWEAVHLYQTWMVVSLARLSSDREIEVRTRQGTAIVFAADGDFFLQLARLNSMWERLGASSRSASKIDLSLGREVAVTFDALSAPQPAAAPRPTPAPGFSFFTNSQSNPKRELQN